MVPDFESKMAGDPYVSQSDLIHCDQFLPELDHEFFWNPSRLRIWPSNLRWNIWNPVGSCCKQSNQSTVPWWSFQIKRSNVCCISLDVSCTMSHMVVYISHGSARPHHSPQPGEIYGDLGNITNFLSAFMLFALCCLVWSHHVFCFIVITSHLHTIVI